MPGTDRRRRWPRRAALGLLGMVVVGLAVSWIVAGRLVAARPAVIGKPPDDLDATTISIESQSGSTLAGWHARTPESRGVVVLLHGIHGSRLVMLERARFLVRAGYSVVMIDLRGHGESTGDVVTIGHLERHDARAAVEFARREHPGEPIAVIGVSLGGAAALLASPLDVDALILESVFPTVRDAVHNRVAARLGWLGGLPAELLLLQLPLRLGVSPADLRPIDHVPNVDAPLLVISGTADSHTTEAETRAMFEAAGEPRELWLVEGAGHVDLHAFDTAEYEARVLAFLGRWLAEP